MEALAEAKPLQADEEVVDVPPVPPTLTSPFMLRVEPQLSWNERVRRVGYHWTNHYLTDGTFPQLGSAEMLARISSWEARYLYFDERRPTVACVEQYTYGMHFGVWLLAGPEHLMADALVPTAVNRTRPVFGLGTRPMIGTERYVACSNCMRENHRVLFIQQESLDFLPGSSFLLVRPFS